VNWSSDVSLLRKSGHLSEALAKAREGFAADPNDTYLQRAYGWVIYDLVKQEAQLFEQGKSSPGRVVNRLNEWLSDYRQFGANERPGMLHSLLLTQVLKGGRAWPGFLEFAQWWGPEYCRPEDKEPYKADNGKLLPSMEMRLFYAIGREASHRADELEPQLLAWAEAQLQVGLSIAPDDQWLHYYKSKQLLDQGKNVEAREWMMPVVRRQQRAAWVWTLLGQTFEPTETDKATTCYFRAVQVAGQPQEVANTRIALARLLASAERFDEAALQIRKALEYRSQNNFSVPQALMQMAGSDWFRSRADRTDLPREPDISDAAEAIAFGGESGEIVYRTGVIDNQNSEKALAHVAFSIDDGVVLPYRRFKGVSEMRVGDIIQVGLAGDDQRTIKWKKSNATTLDGFVREFAGELTQRAGQSFGFVISLDNERIFVHPSLLAESAFTDGTSITCRAVVGKDKQGKQGWRALTLEATDDRNKIHQDTEAL
jgi:tetratricopeptide (TPR) repeat protein